MSSSSSSSSSSKIAVYNKQAVLEPSYRCGLQWITGLEGLKCSRSELLNIYFQLQLLLVWYDYRVNCHFCN
jgi:hypothetical protein